MEPLRVQQDLEEERSFFPKQDKDQSTDINADSPWTFGLPSETIPMVIVNFNSKVNVNGFKLQGRDGISPKLKLILSAKYEADQDFEVLEDEQLVADFTNQKTVSVALPSPLRGLLAIRLQLELVDEDYTGSGSLRLDVLGCKEGKSIWTIFMFIYNKIHDCNRAQYCNPTTRQRRSKTPTTGKKSTITI